MADTGRYGGYWQVWRILAGMAVILAYMADTGIYG